MRSRTRPFATSGVKLEWLARRWSCRARIPRRAAGARRNRLPPASGRCSAHEATTVRELARVIQESPSAPAPTFSTTTESVPESASTTRSSGLTSSCQNRDRVESGDSLNADARRTGARNILRARTHNKAPAPRRRRRCRRSAESPRLGWAEQHLPLTPPRPHHRRVRPRCLGAVRYGHPSRPPRSAFLWTEGSAPSPNPPLPVTRCKCGRYRPGAPSPRRSYPQTNQTTRSGFGRRRR